MKRLVHVCNHLMCIYVCISIITIDLFLFFFVCVCVCLCACVLVFCACACVCVCVCVGQCLFLPPVLLASSSSCFRVPDYRNRHNPAPEIKAPARPSGLAALTPNHPSDPFNWSSHPRNLESCQGHLAHETEPGLPQVRE